MGPFNEYGLLSAGIHNVESAEFVKVFGFNSKRRDMIEKGLKPFLVEVFACPVKTVYVDGRFVTTKENPSDIDVYIVTDTSSDLFIFISSNCERWKLEYRMDVQIAYSDMEGECSVEWWKDYFSTTLNSTIRKGFVALDS